jgi:mono/diheme cytochrome c family protein
MKRFASTWFALRAACFVVMVTLAGCGQNMARQPKIGPQSDSKAFAQQSASRPLPAHVVAREEPAVATPPVTAELLERGQERFGIFCSPCHGEAGYGDGMIVQRGFRRPPSYHDPRLRAAPASHFYEVISKGFGAMYPYASSVAPRDRWAIITYIRALQLSQNASLAGTAP